MYRRAEQGTPWTRNELEDVHVCAGLDDDGGQPLFTDVPSEGHIRVGFTNAGQIAAGRSVLGGAVANGSSVLIRSCRARNRVSGQRPAERQRDTRLLEVTQRLESGS